MASPLGVILAGGQSRRMGEAHKAAMSLAGEALIAHVIRRLEPQVDSIMLSTEGPDEVLDSLGYSTVVDLMPRYRGPLTGLCSALHHLVEQTPRQSLVLCPCDAPFIPLDLVRKLVEAGDTDSKPVAVASYQGFLQPTFSLWQAHHLPVIHDAVVNRGEGGLKFMLESLPHVVVEWVSAEPPPFYNVNTPEELAVANDWIG